VEPSGNRAIATIADEVDELRGGEDDAELGKVATVVGRFFADRPRSLALALADEEQGDAGFENAGEIIVCQKRISADLVEQRFILVDDHSAMLIQGHFQGRRQIVEKVSLSATAHLWMGVEQELQPGRARLDGPANEENLFLSQLGYLRLQSLIMIHCRPG
jgi:hypothetical protein